MQVLLEGLNSQFKAFGEELSIVSDDVKKMKGRLAQIEGDISRLNISDLAKSSKLDAISGRLTSIEELLKKIKPKADREEVKEIEKRVILLEKKLKV